MQIWTTWEIGMARSLRDRWTRFDRLFAQLLGTLDERENSRGDYRAAAELTDATDRLHRLRADLAIARCEVTTDNPNQPCTHDPTI